MFHWLHVFNIIILFLWCLTWQLWILETEFRTLWMSLSHHCSLYLLYMWLAFSFGLCSILIYWILQLLHCYNVKYLIFTESKFLLSSLCLCVGGYALFLMGDIWICLCFCTPLHTMLVVYHSTSTSHFAICWTLFLQLCCSARFPVFYCFLSYYIPLCCLFVFWPGLCISLFISLWCLLCVPILFSAVFVLSTYRSKLNLFIAYLIGIF